MIHVAAQEHSSISDQPASPAEPPPAPGLNWRLGSILVVVALAGIGIALWQRSNRTIPLDGKLMVFVRPEASAREPLAIEKEGAVPVRTGGSMVLEVDLNQPAMIYLVWLNSAGQTVPLYPWNTDKLEVTDINEPLPVRRPTKKLFSPLVFGGGWPFGEQSGMETVLLLARREPLDAHIKLASLIGEMTAATAVREKNEVTILSQDGKAKTATTLLAIGRGDEKEAEAAEAPLRGLMARLSEHFELIRAVRFTHVNE